MSKRLSNKNIKKNKVKSHPKTMSKSLSLTHINALKDAVSLPVSFIRIFHEFLDMKVLTNTTPIQAIINNKFLPWDTSVIVNKKDLRMIHTKHFNLKWNYYKLTIDEPDVCNIAKYIDLNWNISAIKEMNINKFCSEHLLIIINKYNEINWNWEDITIKFDLEDILKNLTLNWHYPCISEKLLKVDIRSELFISALYNLNHSNLNWKLITDHVNWGFIGNNIELPWVYINKFICNCPLTCQTLTGKTLTGQTLTCQNFLDLYTIKKLKSKPLNWKQITKFQSYQTIYENPEIPWDEEAIIADYYAPLWFVEITNYNWDMKRITQTSSWLNIRLFPSMKWDIDELVILHDDIIPPIDVISRFSKSKWDWDKLSELVIFDDIITYILPWNWEIIKKRNNIPFRFLISFPEKSWDYYKIKTDDKYEEKMLEIYKILDKFFIKQISILVFRKLYF